MTSHYDKSTGRWEVTSGFITVRGPDYEGCVQRLNDLLDRYRTMQVIREAITCET
jgi:hypothetical protein